MTHTYAVLEVPRTIYKAMRAHLVKAKYDHAFIVDISDGEVIDMHGIALKERKGDDENTHIVVSSILSAETKEARIEISLNGELTQMDLTKAREVVGMLQGAIEAAASDQMIFQFLTEKVGMDPGKAGWALLDFREMRQGSRDVVNPS